MFPLIVQPVIATVPPFVWRMLMPAPCAPPPPVASAMFPEKLQFVMFTSCLSEKRFSPVPHSAVRLFVKAQPVKVAVPRKTFVTVSPARPDAPLSTFTPPP